MFKFNIRFVIVALTMLAFVNLKTDEPKAPLSKLPSKEGSHIEKVKNLKAQTFLNLGKPEPDPKWGPAWGRAFTPKMPYAKDLEGAFLHGQGVHAFYKKEWDRGMDDTWFYDVNAHAWLCCYPGNHIPSLLEKDEWHINKDGFLENKDGQSPPMVGLVHGYNLPSYSSDLKQFITFHDIGYGHKNFFQLWKTKFPDEKSYKGTSKNPQKYIKGQILI